MTGIRHSPSTVAAMVNARAAARLGRLAAVQEMLVSSRPDAG